MEGLGTSGCCRTSVVSALHVQVPQEMVDMLHEQHYAAVVDLFERHKGSFPGYENVTLAVEHG